MGVCWQEYVFLWHHYFHLLQSENIDIISNGVDGCYGKHYSQDFISFQNDAGERKVFTAFISEWKECPDRPMWYFSLLRPLLLHQRVDSKGRSIVSTHFLGYTLLLPLHLVLKGEHWEDLQHWDGFGKKTRFRRNRFIPEWFWGENKTSRV